jgi:hypothetical protein
VAECGGVRVRDDGPRAGECLLEPSEGLLDEAIDRELRWELEVAPDAERVEFVPADRGVLFTEGHQEGARREDLNGGKPGCVAGTR